MHMFSRCVVVGFLLAIAAISSGCQPVQPPTSVPTTLHESSVESEAISETVVSDSSAISESNTVVESVSETVTVDSAPLTTTAEISVTAEEVATKESADPALLAAGMAAYRAQYCGICHTLDAAETHGTFGPEHNGMGAMAAARIADSNYSGAATTPAEYIYESIVTPQAYTVPGYATTSHRMPSYVHLDEATLNELVAFLLSQ